MAKHISLNSTTMPSPNSEGVLTLIGFILDESGSMNSDRESTIKGVNTWLDEQVNCDGEALLTLNKFDGNEVRTLWENMPIENVGRLNEQNYSPNSMTNLNDAIAQTISQIEKKYNSLKKENKNVAVLITIMTDGGENNSREFPQSRVGELKKIMDKKKESGWTFTFMGADLDAQAMSMSYGISTGNTRSFKKGLIAESMKAEAHATKMFRTIYSSGAANGVFASTLYEDAGIQDENTYKN